MGIAPGEKPLDRIVTDGGMCAIFRRIACIGDSLSSGEFESVKEDGTHVYHDMYEYSWGSFITPKFLPLPFCQAGKVTLIHLLGLRAF